MGKVGHFWANMVSMSAIRGLETIQATDGN